MIAGLLLAALVRIDPQAPPQAPADPDAALIGGPWEISNAERDKSCTAVFRNDADQVFVRVDARLNESHTLMVRVDGRRNTSDATRIDGRGELDLRQRRLDLLLTPQPRQPAVLALKQSIRVRGPWSTLSIDRVPQEAIRPAAGCPARSGE